MLHSFNASDKNPRLPSAKDTHLPFEVIVTTRHGSTVYSRHATDKEAWVQAKASNKLWEETKQRPNTGFGLIPERDMYTACDELGKPLVFKKEYEEEAATTDQPQPA